MHPRSLRSLSYLIGLNSVYLGVNYLWMSYEAIILPIQVGLSVQQEYKGFVLGIVAAVGSLIGLSVNMLSGVLGDRIRFFGSRRSPYIIIGTSLAILTLIWESFLSFYLAIVLFGYIMIQISGNLSSGSYQPFLAEVVNSSQRGASAGIGGFFTLIGSALGFGVTGYLVGIGYFSLSLYSISVILLIGTFLTIITVRKEDKIISSGVKFSREKLRRTIHEVRNLKRFTRLLLGCFLVFMGATGLTFFEFYYFKDVLLLHNPAYSLAVAGVLILTVSGVSTVIFGHYSDRFGRRRILIAATIVASISIAFIPIFRTFQNFLILGSIYGGAFGVFFSVSLALAGDLVPRGDAGRYMSFFNLSVGGATAISPALLGMIFLVFSGSAVNAFISLFEISALFTMLGAILLAFFFRKDVVAGKLSL